MSDPHRVPSLVLPFAIVGGAAGWLTTDFLANPYVGISNRGAGTLAALSAAIAAALIGAALTRWCGTRMDWHPRGATWLRLASLVLVSGALVGAFVVCVMDRDRSYAHLGAAYGLGAAVAFLPVCALVLTTAKRAERARLGSLVAASDRRAVWAILMSALAIPMVAAIVDWPVVHCLGWWGETPPPWPAVAILAFAFVLLALSLYADRRALSSVERAAADQALEARAPAEIAEGERVPRLDLGLGDDVRAAVARGQAVYRDRGRPTSLVLGSVEEAAVALRRAVRRDVIGLAVVSAAIGVHAVAFLERDQVRDPWASWQIEHCRGE